MNMLQVSKLTSGATNWYPWDNIGNTEHCIIPNSIMTMVMCIVTLLLRVIDDPIKVRCTVYML